MKSAPSGRLDSIRVIELFFCLCNDQLSLGSVNVFTVISFLKITNNGPLTAVVDLIEPLGKETHLSCSVEK